MPTGTLIYDDTCGFCTWAANRIENRTTLRLVGFSELTPTLEAHLPPDYEACAHLLINDDRYSCGAALETAFLLTPTGTHLKPLFNVLHSFDAYHSLREWAYQRIANNRHLLGKLLSDPPPANDSN